MTDFFESFEEDAAEIAREGIEAFRRAIERYGLTLTEDLKRDFQYHVIRSATQLILEFDFRQYGRFKDMAMLRYASHMPPVEAMEFFVDKVGLDQFAYVDGYKGKQVPTVKNATARIAWAIAMGRRRVPSVARGYRGTWYNSTKVEIINSAKNRIHKRISEFSMVSLKSSINF
ncbi:hypothetical protein [Larkinella sp. C7]|uniref:hypothetical protein n=1 Tax=Larkinella sp. C7 TaxID=2576607 RepID=UPI00111103CE|nr:hypothetical protein [Larkinella sp. C7]